MAGAQGLPPRLAGVQGLPPRLAGAHGLSPRLAGAHGFSPRAWATGITDSTLTGEGATAAAVIATANAGTEAERKRRDLERVIFLSC